MTRHLALVAVVVGLLAGSAPAGDQTILGKSITVKSAPGDATRRQVKGSAKEKASPNTLVGDPTVAGGAGGAVLTIVANGGTPSVRTFVLNQGTSSGGEPFWSGDVVEGFKYRDPGGEQGAVERASIRRSPSGSFVMKLSLSGRTARSRSSRRTPGPMLASRSSSASTGRRATATASSSGRRARSRTTATCSSRRSTRWSRACARRSSPRRPRRPRARR